MAYADKRDGKLTGSFVGEWPAGKKKRRFKTLQDAKDYETFCKLMGREPPTVTEDGNPAKAEGEKTFAEVARLCLAAGGPKGKWNAERDKSVIQRVEFCVDRIGAYGITRVTRGLIKEKVLASLDRAKAPGKDHLLSNGTKNRYLTALSAVMRYAVDEEIIEHAPKMPWLDERADRKGRDVLARGQDEVILRLMREAGDELEALCVEVLLDTGLRSGELQKLTPDQITIEQIEDEEGTSVLEGIIRLRKDQTKNNTCRPVIFSADLAKQIKAVIAAGKLPKGDKVLDTFKSAVERAGIKGNLVIHSLRHTRNTFLFKADVDQSQRKEMLGHLTDSANDIYTHRDLADQLKAVKKVREYAGKRQQNVAASVVAFEKKSA